MNNTKNKSLKLKMYPANNGDAFLLLATVPKTVTILIDGGYATTYKKHISKDLVSLAARGHYLDLVVATHIDADHIAGLIEFFEQNGDSNSPHIIPVKNVWHNSVRSLSAKLTSCSRSDNLELVTDISHQGYPASPECSPEEVSARQGSSLAALLLDGKYRWNDTNGNNSINSTYSSLSQEGDHVQFNIISPHPKRLEELKEWWLRELQKLGFIGSIGDNCVFDDAFEFLCARIQSSIVDNEAPVQISSSTSSTLDKDYVQDKSITNSSSIAFIAHIGSAQLLFLGDAWSEDIEQELEKLKSKDGPIVFDAIKISHHGSLHNTSVSLLEMIDSPAYFISTNGSRHNHPDLAVLKAIVDRPCEFKRNLYFSHSTSASKFMKNYKSKLGTGFTIHENANDWIELNTDIL